MLSKFSLTTEFVLAHKGTVYSEPAGDFWKLTAAESSAALYYSLIEDERIILALTGALPSEI